MARRLLWLIPSTLIGGFAGVRLTLSSDFVSRELAATIASELATRTRSSVQLSGVTFGYSFAPCFQHLEIYRYTGPYKFKIATTEACVERWASAVGSGFHAVRLKLTQPSIEISANPDAEKNPGAVESPGAAKKAAEGRATLREIQIIFDDLRLDWDAMPFPERFASGTFGPIDGSVTVQQRGTMSAASISLREPATGSRIHGRATPTPTGWDLSAGVEGDLVPIFDTLLAAAAIDIRKMPSKGQIGVDYRAKDKSLTIDLDMEQEDLDVANDAVSSQRLRGFAAREKLRMNVDIGAGKLDVSDALVEVNGIPLLLSVKMEPGTSSPAFAVAVDLKTMSLARLLRSVPGAVELEMAKQMSPSINFAFTYSMTGELRDPTTWVTKLDHRFQGIDDPGVKTGVEYLNGAFEYRPLTKEGRTGAGRAVGRGTPGWTAYNDIPYLQRRCIIVSEDSTFFFHSGIELEEMRMAIQKSVETGEKARGGSTITQQLIKNLFLSRDRTALRKLQELLLTYYLEAAFSKEYLFELYVNVIEWGPDLYGLHDAALHYFGRPPKKLQTREMAYLASIIPGPLLFHAHYEKGQVSSKHNAKVDALLERLNRLGQLDDAELAKAKEQRIKFYRPKS
jgi:hypothetical protein